MDDFWTLRPKEIQKGAKHLFETKDSKSESGHSLLVHVAATHAAIVNGNRRFYRPDKMQEGVHTFLPAKREDGTVLRNPAPVLIGHNENGDVIGRVLQAKYHDESYRYHAEFSTIKDFVFYQRDGKKRLDVFKSVDWIVENLVPLKDYTGLGYVDLGVKLTNPESIRKVLADEYLSVSVGFKTDSAICSVCHTDWADDGKCEHTAGEMVDGKPMFLISGSMVFEELSFVNFGADPFATTLSKDTFTDSQKRTFFLGLSVKQQNQLVAVHKMTDSLIFESDMTVTEETMSVAIDVTKLNELSDELKSAELTAERAQVIKTSLATWEPETDSLKTKKRSLFSTVNAKIRKNNWDQIEAPSESDAAAQEELDSLLNPAAKKTGAQNDAPCACANLTDCTCWDAWVPESDEEKEYFADAAGLYQEFVLELQRAVKDGELPAAATLTEDGLKQALKGSFCGPNRSFPVVDKAHAAAARKILVASKLSDAIKVKITKLIDQRAAALPEQVAAVKEIAAVAGVETKTGKTKDSHDELITQTLLKDDTKIVTPEERATLVAAVKHLDTSYDSITGSDAQWALRWAVRAMMTDWDADDDVAWALQRLAGTDHLANATDLAEKEEAVNTLTGERDALQAELKIVRDSRVAIMTATKRTLAQQIVMHKVLTAVDGFKDLKQAEVAIKIDELAKRHISSLQDSVSDLLVALKFSDKSDAVVLETPPSVDPNLTIADATSGEGVTTTPKEKDKPAEAVKKVLSASPYLTPTERRRIEASAQFKKK
jgi:hypothetical protein